MGPEKDLRTGGLTFLVIITEDSGPEKEGSGSIIQ